MIRRLQIESFRGIRHLEIDFARFNLLSGRNGLGKTTVFDALDWCLFRSTWRLSERPGAEVNLYANDAQPRVQAWLAIDGAEHRVLRTPYGVHLDGQSCDERDILDLLVTKGDEIAPFTRAASLALRLRRLTYLPQEDVRKLLWPSAREERIALFQSFLGVPGSERAASGIRRVREHLTSLRSSIREDRQASRLAAQSLLERLGPAGQEDSEKLERTRQEAISVLRDPADARNAGFRDLLASVRRRIGAVDQVIDGARHVEVLRARLQEADLLHARQAERDAEELRRIRARAGELDELSRASAAALAEIGQELDGLRSTSRNTEAECSVREWAQTLQKALASARDQIVAVEGRRAELVARQRTLEKELVAREERLRDLREARRVAARDVADTQGLVAEARHRADQRARVGQLALRIGELEEALGRRKVGLEDRQGRVEVVGARAAELEMVTQRSGGGELVIDALETLASYVDEEKIDACALCGTSFPSNAALVLHIRARVVALSEVAEQRARARAELSSCRSTIAALRAEIADLEAATQIDREEIVGLRSLHQELNIIEANASPDEAQLVRLLDQRSGRLGEIDTEAASVAASTGSLREEVRELARLVAACDGEAASAKEAESQARRTVEQLATSAPTEEDLEFLRNQLGAIKAQIVAKEEARRKLLAEASSRDRQLADIEAHEADVVARARGRLEVHASLETSIEQASAELRERAAGAGVGDSLRRDLLESLRARLAGLSEKLTTAVTWEESQSNRRAVEELRVREQTLEERARQVESAEGKFEPIAQALLDRAGRESAKALEVLQDSIQECLSSLYPYRHLDHVSMRPEDYSVLVSDDIVTTPVEPAFFFSTGQANALAIAVFLGCSTGQSFSRLRTLMLDEPVQNFDDLHYLALLTLLKRAALDRQVIFSTGDRNIAELTWRQLQSSWTVEAGGAKRFEWTSFEAESGPEVLVSEARLGAVA